MRLSIIIPIYNRPQELQELLDSCIRQSCRDFDIVVVEDGSEIDSRSVVEDYKNTLDIQYYTKANSGPGLSRNYGMARAKGDYFIILDSDTLLPEHYMSSVKDALASDFTHSYGGADAAHKSFTSVQKAINYSMTSLLTTGGLRGHKSKKDFQPRSFNMGLSRKAFDKTGGFSPQRFGEDIDLSLRLKELGMKTQFIPKAFVYHKRRNTWKSFFKQTLNFGAARPILNLQHSGSSKLTYYFPSLFFISIIIAIPLALGDNYILIYIISMYLALNLFHSTYLNKSITVGLFSVLSTIIQFTGYGIGFMRSFVRLHVLGFSQKKAFPTMFNK